jgi:chemotaxis protein CheZ
MSQPRKIFRIEQTATARPQPQTKAAQPPNIAEVMHELSALRDLFAAVSPRPADTAEPLRNDEIERLTAELRRAHAAIGGSGSGESSTRVTSELAAATSGSEQAVQKILAAAEDIDQAANNLTATLKGDIERGLAQDIRDRVIQIFEACNFQDLSSQRVAKVMTALGRIERQIARTLNEGAHDVAAPPAHGPRLPHDHGHVSQSDLDAMFAPKVKSA